MLDLSSIYFYFRMKAANLYPEFIMPVAPMVQTHVLAVHMRPWGN